MKNFKYNRLNKDDAAVLLVDHQAGLLSLVRDIEPDRFKNNVNTVVDQHFGDVEKGFAEAADRSVAFLCTD